MAKDQSPASIGERAMFAPDAAPFALPPPKRVAADVTGEGIADARPAASPPRAMPPVSTTPAFRWLAKASLPAWGDAVRAASRAVETELDRGIAFVLAPVFLAVGAIIYFALAREPALASLAAGAVVLGILALATRSRPALNMPIAAALLLVLGALAAKTETLRADTKMLGGEVTTRLEGTVARIERLASGRVRLTIDVTATARPVLRHAPDRVRLSARRIPDGVAAGASVSGLVRLMPPSGPVRPDSYDFSFESYFDGIGASGYFLSGPEPIPSAAKASAVSAFKVAVERYRHAVAERISGHIGGAEGEIAAALVVGVRAGIPEDVNEALRKAGIYHIISISGLHMALVAGSIMWMLRSGFALFPDFASRHAVKKYAAALALIGLAGYLFISGAEVAAQRSFIMIAVMLAAVLLDRAALTLRNLAIAAIIVIALSPHEVVGPSFQMSFAATVALVGVYAAWSDWRTERPAGPPLARSLPVRLLRAVLLGFAGLAVTSIAAGGATAIYAAWHFQQMPSLGLFTNLAAMPIVSFVVMPFAVLGSLAMPFGLDGPFFQVMGIGLAWTVAIAQWFAERSPSDIVGLVPASAVAVLTVALLVATVFSTWLRLAAVPIAAAGFFLLIERPEPDLFASEDGRLVGLGIGDGIAVNRARPSQFTADNWRRALQADAVVRPEGRQQRSAAQSADATGDGTGAAKNLDGAAGFVCGDGLCLARHPAGATVAHALDTQAATDACAVAEVIVIEDATAANACRWSDALVVTGRDLAVGGSAAIVLSDDAPAEIRFAIATPYRPWHDQRRFSRAARGLPPYRRPAAETRKPDAKPSGPARSAVGQDETGQ
ncbi:ComEC/Rec2 family competence protein [Mesorhizobium sp. ZMM04-5]|uniref:ComEC/Rec2 family competence protein n=1 Tax=Mesorhizobium marinum TaxID=3228790 RepID=A0ABV3R4Z1_9HYPH